MNTDNDDENVTSAGKLFHVHKDAVYKQPEINEGDNTLSEEQGRVTRPQ